MKKMPTIFIRDPDNMSSILDEPHPDCAWVFAGEGIATKKYDGTCCMIDEDRKFWKRREVKPGKTAPDGFVSLGVDPNTGKEMGWVPVDFDDKADRWHLEAYNDMRLPVIAGTYELLGPKIQGNPEQVEQHTLVPHSEAYVYDCPDRTYEGIRETMKPWDIEGFVFKHPDGRMAKIKKSDYGDAR